jgi:hypothetical protein
MNCCTTERCCQLQFINSYTTVFHDVRETWHSWQCASCCWVAWTDSLLDSFMLTVATFHPSKYSAMTCGNFSTYGFLVTHLSPKQACDTRLSKTLPSIVHDSTPLSDTIIPWKWNLHHPLVPYIGWMVNERPLPHNMRISWMAEYLSLHITSMSVSHLWMALVEEECLNLMLYIFHAIDAHK